MRADRIDDLGTMLAAIFDEDLVRPVPTYDNACYEDPFEIGLHGLGIMCGHPGLWIDRDSELAEEPWIGCVSGHSEDEIIIDLLDRAIGLGAEPDGIGQDLGDARIPADLDISISDPPLDI